MNLNLRDYFASSAMNSIISNNSDIELDNEEIELITKQAYKIADSMLKARKLPSIYARENDNEYKEDTENSKNSA